MQLAANVFDLSQTTVDLTENNAHIVDGTIEQNLFIVTPVMVMKSVEGYFYTILLPENFSTDDQFVGVIS